MIFHNLSSLSYGSNFLFHQDIYLWCLVPVTKRKLHICQFELALLYIISRCKEWDLLNTLKCVPLSCAHGTCN